MSMSTIVKNAFIVLVAISVVQMTHAMPANPEPLNYEQPDGSETPLIHLRGDAYYNWMEDTKGYTVMEDTDGWFVYAKKEGGRLVSSGARVGFVNPKKMGLIPNLTDDHHLRHENQDENGVHAAQYSRFEQSVEHRSLFDKPSSALCSFGGSKKDPCELRNLVLLVQFSNHKNRKLPEQSQYYRLFNNNGPTDNDDAPTGSVSDVFLKNSFDKFKVTSTVSNWIKVGRSEKDTVDGKNGMQTNGARLTWAEAIKTYENSRNDGLNYFDEDGDGLIDALCILHSGTGAEAGGKDCESGGAAASRVWSHATANQGLYKSGTGKKTNRYYVASAVWGRCPPGKKNTLWQIARVAVIAHEIGHFLGLPDLYDGEGGQGVGRFDLLGQCWGWKRNQLYPPAMGAWSRSKLQWVDVKEITQSGTYTAGPSCSSDKVFKISHGMPDGEYFLVENRFACGLDTELAPKKASRYRGGLAIWHIDETSNEQITYKSSGYPGDGKWPAVHYAVALVQCDGQFSLEKNKGQGDENDLCKHDPQGKLKKTKKQGYSVGPNGLELNGGGKTIPETNTNSYSSGKEKPTGITITAGEVAQQMKFTVELPGGGASSGGGGTGSTTKRSGSGGGGTSTTTNKRSGSGGGTTTDKRSGSGGVTTTDKRSGARPADENTSSGTRTRSGASSNNRSGGSTSTTGTRARGRDASDDPSSSSSSSSNSAIPITCQNNGRDVVKFKGVGKDTNKWRVKTCEWIKEQMENKDEPRDFCSLANDITDQEIYLTCQKECARLSKCGN